MEDKIIINTTSIGVRLYNQTAKSLTYHYKQLDQIKIWKNQLDALKAMVPQSTNIVDFKGLTALLDHGALVNIAMLDLAAIARYLLITEDKWERLFYAKHGYTLIYETIEQYNKQSIGLRRMINAKAQHLVLEWDNIGSELRIFKKDYGYDTIIRTIRNKVGAHIHSFDTYYDTLHSIEPTEATKAIEQFILILVKVLNISTALIGVYQKDMDDNLEKMMTSINNLQSKLNL